jgi:hypothetical protein
LEENCPKQRLWVAMNLVSEQLNSVLDKEPIQEYFKELAKIVDH